MLEYGGPYSSSAIPANCLANYAAALQARGVALGTDVYVDDETNLFSSAEATAIVNFVKNSSATNGFAKGIQFVLGHGASGHTSNKGKYWPAWSGYAAGTLMLYSGSVSPGVCGTLYSDGQSYNAESKFLSTPAWYLNPAARLIFGTGGYEPVVGGKGPTSPTYLAAQLEYAMGTPCIKFNGNPCAYRHLAEFTAMVNQGRVDWPK